MKKTFESMFVQRNPKYEHLLPRMRAALGVEEVTFADINTANMRTFREYMKKQVTANSLSTYFAVLKATINEMAADGLIENAKCLSALKIRKTPTQNCCLTEDEIIKFDEYIPRSSTENDAKILFMRGALSGARSSDCKKMDIENIQDGTLTYVSQKTKIGVTQPLHKRLIKYLEQAPLKEHSRASINYAIRNICKRLGFTEPVTLSRDGKMVTKPKYEWITIHGSRRSYVTSLVERNVPIAIVGKLAGHTSTRITDHYVCSNALHLGDDAMGFFDR